MINDSQREQDGPHKRDLVRLIIQPTVSHYREPLIEVLKRQTVLPLSLFGRYANAEYRRLNRIASASAETLADVDKLDSRQVGPLRWEVGIVSSVLRKEYGAYVLEGRVYTVSTWLALMAGRVFRVPVLLWGHGWKRPEAGIKRAFRLAFYRLSSGVLVYGEWARAYAISVGVPESSVAVVGNSIYSRPELDRCIRTRAARSEMPFTVIVSVRLTARHRVDLLARAVERMSARSGGIRVLIVGDGDQIDHLKAEFFASGIDAEFLGGIYGANELAGLYDRADVAVSPRASGLNVVQGLGFGCPVIVPDMDPTSGPESELVEDGVTGLRFELDDVGDLATALEYIRDNPERSARMGSQGRDRVLRTHTAEAHGESIVESLGSFLSDAG